jgi:dipeptidase E
MKLLLASDTDFVYDHGFDLLGIPKEKLNVAYISTAGKGSEHPHLPDNKRLKQLKEFNVTSYDIEGKTKDELRQFVFDKNVIWVGGGNTFYLLRAIKATGFDKIIMEEIAKGKVYIGVSAGSYIACPTIEVATWRETNRHGVTDLTALNLVPFVIKAHYVPEMANALKEKISNCQYEVKILNDNQAILVNDGKYTLV